MPLTLRRAGWTPWLLFLGGALISAFTIRQGIDPFDEGIALSAARRVANGQVPYADFTWAYGPATPYLLAGLFKVFGLSLLQWRVLRVIADAGVALVVWVLLRRFEVPPRVALLGWLAATCAMAQPRSANPFPFALLFALLAILAATDRRLVVAALLTALSAAFRLDFALYGAAAITVMLLAEREWKAAVRCLALIAAFSLAAYLPFLIDIGPAKLYQALIGTSLHDRNYWTLSFPLSYGGGISVRPHALKDILDYYQPLLLVIGLGIAAFMRRAGLALLVLGLGALSYLLSRTDEFHTQPLFVVLAVLLPALAIRKRPRVVVVAAAVVFALMLAEGVANRLSALFRPPAMSEVHVAAADGVEAPPPEARALERVVADVDRLAPSPGDPIYVAPRRSDLVTFSNSIVYVLADRDNAANMDFGLVTSAAEQQAIVDRLRARRPRVIVRWTDPLSSKQEPNLRGRASGSHALDDYLASDYRLLERLYHYDVLVPR
jgi:hypothetical protein